MMASFMTFYVLCLSFFASVFAPFAAAAPLEVTKRDVWDPKMTYPHAGTVWYVGQRHNVTWETSDAPKQITNSVGFILFRFDNIETPLVLASGFNVLDGRVEVTVPNVLSGSNYSLVLFGDSGNWGPTFTIEGGPDF